MYTKQVVTKVHILIWDVRNYFFRKEVYKLKSKVLLVKANGESIPGERKYMQRSCDRREHDTFKEVKEQADQRAVVQNETGLLRRVQLIFGLTVQLQNLTFYTKNNGQPLENQVCVGWQGWGDIVSYLKITLAALLHITCLRKECMLPIFETWFMLYSVF